MTDQQASFMLLIGTGRSIGKGRSRGKEVKMIENGGEWW
jgi:hypothetical protein